MTLYKAYALEFRSDGSLRRINSHNSNITGDYWEDDEGRFGGSVIAKNEEQAIKLLIEERKRRKIMT